MTGMRFAGRLAPNVKNVTPSANSPGDDIVTFTCGHVRIISPAVRNRLIDAGGHPVCLQCDGTTPKPMPCGCDPTTTECRAGSFDKCQAIQHGMAQHAAAADATHFDALVQHVTTLEHKLRRLEERHAGLVVDGAKRLAEQSCNDATRQSAIAALTERVEKLEAAVAPACIAYYPEQHTPRWWWQR